MYDPALGRWHCIDKLSEKYYSLSNYAYCANNPIRLIDVDGRWFDDKNEKRAQRQENKLIKKQGKLANKVVKMAAKGKDTGDLEARQEELDQSLTDISDMRGNETTEFRWASQSQSSNSDSEGVATTEGMGTSVVTMYTKGASMGLVLHENRHGGDIARGTLTKKTYGVQDEVSAYKAQYSWDGKLDYQAADYYTKNPSMGNGINPTNSVPVTSITDINSVTPAVINNMGVKKQVKVGTTTNHIWINLYSPQDKKWNSN